MNLWVILGGIAGYLLVVTLVCLFFKGAKIARGDED